MAMSSAGVGAAARPTGNTTRWISLPDFEGKR
jgi:hypothetical protein